METALGVLLNSPLTGILLLTSIGAVSLVIYFIARDYSNREEQFRNFETRIFNFKNQIESSMIDHKKSIEEESTKVSQNFQDLKDETFRYKNIIREESNSILKKTAKLEAELIKTSSKIVSSSDRLEEGFGKLIRIQKDIENIYGRVIILEKNKK